MTPAHLVMQLASLTVWLVLLLAVFVPLERLFALRPQRLRRPGFATDLGYYFLSFFSVAVLLSLPIAAIVAAARAVIPAGYYEAVAALPVGLRLVLSLIVGEIGFYWGHRWSHEVPLLWRFHAVHHSAEQMDWLVNTRAHPVDMVFGRLCGLAPIYILGLAVPLTAGGGALSAFVLLAGTLWGFFIHANLRWRLGPIEWLVATPAFHHWHHTRREPLDRNYASLLPVMDRLFGTHYLPRAWPDDYGTDWPVGDGIAAQLVEPFAPRRAAKPSAD
jgi:sterol desaturase/sphingolipid hydroxylase (fatty acid hydroxylase superfamily)